MTNKLKMIGFTLGEPLSETSRSGVNYNIFTRFDNSEACDLVDVFDLDIKGLNKLYLAALNFSFNRKRWGNKLHQNPRAFRVRTKMAEYYISNLSKEIDLIYQDGAMFMPGVDNKIPYISYHDSNVVLASSGEQYAHGGHYKGKNLKDTFNQEKLVYEHASIIFTMSDWLKMSLISDFGIPDNKIKTVYAGTNLKVTNRSKDYDGKTILFVGKNFDRKGGNVLLDAFRKVKKVIKDSKLVVIGSNIKLNEEGVEVKGLINDKQELEKYYKQASVFVLPSLFEPFGIVFAEAFAYKLPCIGTNICAMPEIIEEGKGGFLVPPSDSVNLADRIITILKNEELSRDMGEYGFQKALNIYNWDVVVDKILTHSIERYK